ncbi:MAG: LCP family protein [Halanaerobiales bacterium]|nr:LCP family protein [Halanaerobiales bacterium]
MEERNDLVDFKGSTAVNGQNPKRNLHTRRWKVVMSVILAIMILFTGLFAYFLYDFFYGKVQFTSFSDKLVPISKVNILVIGYDSKVNGSPRSDVMMLVSLDLEKKAAGIVSIPRDTRVLIPGHTLHSKVNSAYASGGADLAMSTIREFLGVPVDYYISTNFNGFTEIIETLGGIKINIAKDMDYDDNAGDLHIHLKKGEQVLDGEKAIQYVRYRDDISADLGRIERQQKFIHAAIDQFLNPETILKIPQLISQLTNSIKTNMSLKDMMNLAKLVKDIKGENIKTAQIPGEPAYVNGISYFIHDQQKTELLVNDIIASKEYIANSKCRIGIFNGNGVARGALDVSRDLKLHGFRVNKISNADHYNYQKTVVVYTNEITDEINTLVKIMNAEVIPVEESAYANDSTYENLDALVIVGKDLSSKS